MCIGEWGDASTLFRAQVTLTYRKLQEGIASVSSPLPRDSGTLQGDAGSLLTVSLVTKQH